MGSVGIGIAGLALAAVGTGVSTTGAVEQGQAQRQAADYQAQVAKNNATVEQQNANLASQQAAAKVQSDYRAGAVRLGAERAALGANGGTLDAGSAQDVQDATARATALTANNDAYEGQLQGYGFQTQAANLTSQAALDSATGQNATTASAFNAGSNILSGASQVSSKWASYYTPTSTPVNSSATVGVNNVGWGTGYAGAGGGAVY